MTHRNRFFKGMLAAIAGLAMCGNAAADESTVYSRLYAEFTKHPNRIAGSEALEASFQALEKELRAAGLNPKRQTFPTLVQETERLSFTYNGAPVTGALMIDNGPAAWVLDEPIAGPVVYAGNGAVADTEGKNLAGAIAVVDATLVGVRLYDTFMSGAKAVVLVGDETLDQWRAARMTFSTVSLVPRIYVPRAEAEAAGLLAADGSLRGSIDARSLLKDRETFNLWVELPHKKGWKGALDREESMTLSARLDTYGFTPDYSPDNRYAANAALLADTAIALAKSGELNRKVVVVWFGSHYAAQEGARFLYHSIDMADKVANPTDFPERLKRYERELSTTRQYLRFIRANNIIEQTEDKNREKALALTDEIVKSRQALKKDLGKIAARDTKTLDDIRARVAAATDPERPGYPKDPELLFTNAHLRADSLLTNAVKRRVLEPAVAEQIAQSIITNATKRAQADVAAAKRVLAAETAKAEKISDANAARTRTEKALAQMNDTAAKAEKQLADTIAAALKGRDETITNALRRVESDIANAEKNLAAELLRLETDRPNALKRYEADMTNALVKLEAERKVFDADTVRAQQRLARDFEAAAKKREAEIEKVAAKKAALATIPGIDPEDIAALENDIAEFRGDIAAMRALVAKTGGGGALSADITSLNKALADYGETLAQLGVRIENVGESSVLSKRSIAREMQTRLKREIKTAIGDQREPLGDLRFELNALVKKDDPADEARIAALEKEIADADALRKRWNSLLEQIFKQKFKADEPENAALYEEMIAIVRSDLEKRRAELTQIIRDTKTWQELTAVFQDTAFVAHFDFDFANDTSPWVFSMINAYGVFRNAGLNSGDYLRHLDTFRKIYYGDEAAGVAGVYDAPGAGWAASLYKPALNPVYKPFSLSVPTQRPVPSVVGAGIGYAGFQMMSVGEQLAHDAMPFADDVDLSGLRGQMAALCREFGNSPELSLRRVYADDKREDRYLYTNERGSTKGANFIDYAVGSTENGSLPKNSIAIFATPSMVDNVCGMSHLPRTRILANGFIYMPMVSRGVTGWRQTIGVGYDENGAFERISTTSDSTGIKVTPVHLFKAYGGVLFNSGYAPDPLGNTMYQPKTLIALKDSAFKSSSSYNIAYGPLEFFADRPDKIKRIGAKGEMILGSVQTESRRVDDAMIKAAMGRGVPNNHAFNINFDGYAQGANDSFILNDVRLRTLRERNIVRDDLEELHADAREHIEDARKAVAEKKWSLARAHQVFATCIGNRIYRPLRGVTEDLVQAVVVLLLLNIPFA
ncbi:MAG: hypothetical protein FWG05_01780, partial [Kiritimatiellaeota bacterium]|nr:hypothetical protein [Kiritimatiellota bacterium]